MERTTIANLSRVAEIAMISRLLPKFVVPQSRGMIPGALIDPRTFTGAPRSFVLRINAKVMKSGPRKASILCASVK